MSREWAKTTFIHIVHLDGHISLQFLSASSYKFTRTPSTVLCFGYVEQKFQQKKFLKPTAHQKKSLTSSGSPNYPANYWLNWWRSKTKSTDTKCQTEFLQMLCMFFILSHLSFPSLTLNSLFLQPLGCTYVLNVRINISDCYKLAVVCPDVTVLLRLRSFIPN